MVSIERMQSLEVNCYLTSLLWRKMVVLTWNQEGLQEHIHNLTPHT